MKKSKGITLIALVITVIMLLILAGISIAMITGDNGILSKAIGAKEKTIKAQYEEELNLVITSIRTDAIYKNEQFNMPYVIEKLPEYLEAEGKIDYVWDITDKTVEEPEGEYKDYIFYIDTNYIAHIEAEVGGIKPDILVEVITGNVLEGDTVEIQVTASVTEGTVTIKEIENSIETKRIKDENQNKVYIFKVNKNGKYTFIAESDSGRKNKKILDINNIIEAPKLEISDNDTGTSFKVNVINNYPENANITYTYKLDTVDKANNIESKSYIMDNLTIDTEYIVQVVAVFEGNNLLSEELKVTTISIAPVIKISGGIEKVALEYPILTQYGMANCSLNSIEKGSNLTIEIIKKQKEDANIFYSLDNGNTWIEYTQSFQIQYTGNNVIRAKCINSKGAEFKSGAMLCDGYAYDSEFNCTAEDALDKKAYDMNDNTCWDPASSDNIKSRFNFGNNFDIYNVCFDIGIERPTGVTLMAGRGEDSSGHIWIEETEFVRGNIVHVSCYGRGSTAWWNWNASLANMKVYEIFYDKTL